MATTYYNIKDTVSGETLRGLDVEGVEDWLREMFDGHFPNVETAAWDLAIALKVGDWENVRVLGEFLGLWITIDVDVR